MAPVLAPQSFPSRAEARSAAFRGNYGHHGAPRLLWWTRDSPLPPRYAGQKNTPPGWGTRRGCSVRTEEKGKRAYVLTSVEGLREEVFHAGDKQRTIGILSFQQAGPCPSCLKIIIGERFLDKKPFYLQVESAFSFRFLPDGISTFLRWAVCFPCRRECRGLLAGGKVE